MPNKHTTQHDLTTEFLPFANDVQSLQLGHLTIENQGDLIAIYGSLHIQLDQTSLWHLQQLQQVLTKAILYLEQQPQLPKEITSTPQPSEYIDNPFL